MPSSRLDIPAGAQEPKPGQRHGLWRGGPCASTPPPQGRMVLGPHPLARGRESTPRGLASQTGGLPLARPPLPRGCPSSLGLYGEPNPRLPKFGERNAKKKKSTKKVKGGALPQRHAPGEHRMPVLCPKTAATNGGHERRPRTAARNGGPLAARNGGEERRLHLLVFLILLPCHCIPSSSTAGPPNDAC